jgi:hypothetical protein
MAPALAFASSKLQQTSNHVEDGKVFQHEATPRRQARKTYKNSEWGEKPPVTPPHIDLWSPPRLRIREPKKMGRLRDDAA